MGKRIIANAKVRSLSRAVTMTKYRCYTFQKGAVMVEYTIVTLMVIVALFVPLGGAGSLSGVGLLLQGLRNFQMHSTYLLSLP